MESTGTRESWFNASTELMAVPHQTIRQFQRLQFLFAINIMWPDFIAAWKLLEAFGRIVTCVSVQLHHQDMT